MVERNGGKQLRYRNHHGLAVPDSYDGDSGGGVSPAEALDPNSVEIRFSNPEVAAPRILQIWKMPEIIEHIAGITPDTTEDEIRELYKDQGLVLLTAEAPSGLIVGTVTAQKPAFGATAAGVLRLAVHPEYKNKRIGNKLIKSVNAFIFRDTKDEMNMGLDCRQARASAIVDVEGELAALRAFAREGYVRGAELVKTTRGWSNKYQKQVDRSSQPITLTRTWYRANRRGEHEKYFPGKRATN